MALCSSVNRVWSRLSPIHQLPLTPVEVDALLVEWQQAVRADLQLAALPAAQPRQ